jgi:TRAP-type C4-dicarboxylate transport system substrate-binding protein
MRVPGAFKMVGLSFLALSLLISSVRGAEKDFVIKFATLAPEGSSWMKSFNALKAGVAQKTDDHVQLKIYPGGIVGDETDALRRMQIGQIQGAALTASGLSAIFPDIDVLQIPFLFQTYEQVDHVVARMDSYFRNGFEDRGYILLSWSEAGFVYLMSTIPISRISDLKKAKVWIWEESPIAKAIFDEAGISAIPLSVPDVLVGLQTGVVDVVYAPPSGAISLQWFSRVKYMTDVPLTYLIGATVVKTDVFKKMPQVFQDEIEEAFHRQMDPLKAEIRKENQEAIKVMERGGVKLITPSSEVVEEFKRVSNAAMQHLVGRAFSKKVFDDVLSELQRYGGPKKR